MTTAATISAKLTLDSTQFNRGLNSAQSKMKSFASNVKGYGKSIANFGGGINSMVSNISNGMKNAGASITKNVTLPLGIASGAVLALGVDAMKVGADFEKAMSGVTAILGGDIVQGKQLSDLAIQLGMDPKLIVNSQQAAGVMEELAKQGLTADQILGGAARGAIALSNATGTDFARGAEVAATSMQLFNLRAEEMEMVVNQLTGVANMSRFDVEDMAQAIGMGGAAAKINGVSLEEFATTISLLSNYTSSGSDAGTSFKTMLTRLSPYTDKATDAMKELGIITEEDGNRFFDAAGNMKSMAEVAGVLQETLGDLTQEQRSVALHELFGTDAMRAAVGLMETGEQGFKNMMKEIGKTDAAKNAAIRMDNLAGSMEIFSGILEGLKIKFSQTFGPVLKKLIDKASAWLEKWSPQIGGLFIRLGEMFEKFIDGISGGLDDTDQVPGIFKFFNDMIDAIPEVVANIKSFWNGTLKPFIDNITKGMGGDTSTAGIMTFILGLAALGPALSAVGSLIPVLIPYLLTLASGIETNGPAILDFFTRLLDSLPGFLEMIQGVGEKLGPMLQPLFDAFMNTDPEVMSVIVSILGGLALLGPPLVMLGTAMSGLGTAWTFLSTILPPIITFITATAIPAIIAFAVANAAWLVPLLLIIGVLYLLYLAFKNNFLGIRDFVTGVLQTIGDKIMEMLNKFTNFKQTLASWSPPQWFQSGVQGAGNALQNAGIFKNFPTRDSGGSGSAGNAYMIGKGAQPELFIPDSNGTFMPNADKLGGGSTVYNVVVNNPKKETAEESVRKTLKSISFTGELQS